MSDAIRLGKSPIANQAAPTTPATPKKNPRVMEAAQMYETQFLRYMLQQMRKTVPENEFMPPNQAERMYREQMDDDYVDSWVKNGGIGLSDVIHDQIMERFSHALGEKQRKLGMPQPPLKPLNESAPIKLKSEGPMPLNESQGAPSLKGTTTNPTTSSLQFRLESPGGGVVQSPWAGHVSSVTNDGSRATILIQHEGNLETALSFKGGQAGLRVGQEIAAGAPLGKVYPDSGPVTWRLREKT